jgi:tetratricopeptide (TPR) repeat protein
VVLLGPVTAAGPSPGSVEFFRGKMAFEAGQYPQAKDAFKDAARAGYTPAMAHYWLGKTYQQLQKSEVALKHYQAARKRGLGSHDLGFQIARIHFAFRKYEKTMAEIDELPTSYQRMGEVALMRGTILLDQKLYDEAYAQMKQAVKDFPYKVHTASGYFPELQSLSLADLSKSRIAEIESGAAVGSTDDVAKAPEPPTPKPRVSGLTRFGSEAAFRQKERGTKTYKMHGYESTRGWGKNSGGATIKGSKNWGSASMGASGGS